MFNRSLYKAVAFSLLAGCTASAQANWYLDGESSRLSFISTKNTHTAEVQRFLVLHGKVDPKEPGASRSRAGLGQRACHCVMSACARNCSRSSRFLRR